MIKRLFRLAVLVAFVAAVVWLTRERMLPTPHVPDEPPPHYRSTPPPPQATADDLTEVKGIGPVYAARLHELGITSFRALAEVDASSVADSLGVSAETAAGWAKQAQERVG